MKIFFQKLEYRVLDESTKIENASCPYKTSISEASVKTNRMMSTEGFLQILPVTTLFFLRNLFQFKNLLQKVGFMYQLPKCLYSHFL